ncbi:hypothetical protein TBLA_0A01020 [Henningerozyma blattae CBS 6284]|uniref:t-SNARE coiled-coil homology domain-containing protein n=1 Tax=Henningerozyma blattae (strain ATCC 34711 / CBS 6284 / DSM 70876 / NBRC 10599 / NRRL Y-10934 / UCD 77-7) TaxID=1071380 RepID=I2GUV0_HENB6|nr:hypothetical protein TBLA_0A01020 [Tetrapisispora blattae CBS 6284]CCH57902.1 hypothetical protein TBLA_0A01020 [Tetrapisispora blattae CBS 6284]
MGSNNNNRLTGSSLHRRESERTQLFGFNEPPTSAYENKPSFTYSRDTVTRLESQLEESNSNAMSAMADRLRGLKQLSMDLGNEIRSSNGALDNLGETFESTSSKLKNTFSDMMDMAKRSRTPLKFWLIFFLIIILCFFWVWIT